ncbi:MAG: Gfo/Idh/MocA family oxidoreductase, partial [Planctomycetaceae bacterium]|nr:Gfo/Idh/MocA family oxidoreductase [Planctomycetaceae bacterium]
RLVADGRATLSVLCDPIPENALRIREEFFPQGRVTADVEEGLVTSGIDGVIVATPTHLHFDQVLAVLRHKLPVLCEKPLAETREKIVSLVGEAEKSGAAELMVGYQRRFWSSYRTIKREIDSGRWGKIQAISLHNTEDWKQTQALPGTWRNDPQQNPGGFIGDAGSHKIDMILNLTGSSPIELFARVENCGSMIPIRGSVVAKLEGGIDLSLNFFGDAHHFREDLHMILENGDLLLRDGELWAAREKDLRKISDAEPHSDATRGFLDLLEGKLKNPAPARCALGVWDFTEAILASASQGRNLRLER